MVVITICFYGMSAETHSASLIRDTGYSFVVVVFFFLFLHTSLACVSLSCFCFLAVIPSDCVRSSSGVGYRGLQQSSFSGLSCLNWTNTTRDYDLGTYPDSQTGKETSFKNKLYCSSSARISLLPVMENNVWSRVLVDCSARHAAASLQSDKQTSDALINLFFFFKKRTSSTHFLLLCRPAHCAVMK